MASCIYKSSSASLPKELCSLHARHMSALLETRVFKIEEGSNIRGLND